MATIFFISDDVTVESAGLAKTAIKLPIKLMLLFCPDIELLNKQKYGINIKDYLEQFVNESGFGGISEFDAEDFNLLAHSLSKGQRYLASLNKKERDKYIEKIGFNPFFYDCTGEVPKSLLNKYFYGPDYKFTSEDRRAYKNLIEEVLSTMRADPRYDPDFDLEEYAREHGGEEEE